jgi:hypothetical protein
VNGARDVVSSAALQRRERRRAWMARIGDAALAVCLLGALALTLAPLMVDLLRTEVRSVVQAEEAFSAEHQAGLFAARVTGASLPARPLPEPDEALRR